MGCRSVSGLSRYGAGGSPSSLKGLLTRPLVLLKNVGAGVKIGGVVGLTKCALDLSEVSGSVESDAGAVLGCGSFSADDFDLGHEANGDADRDARLLLTARCDAAFFRNSGFEDGRLEID